MTEKISTAHGNAGGYTHTYRVARKAGSPDNAFLKVHDFASAWDDPNFTRVLAPMFQAYDFERDVLDACISMTHVVRVLGSGAYHVPGTLATHKVSYILLELADGDVRTFLDDSRVATVGWRLRTLHHLAVGLKQLHVGRIAHQDVKPANALVYASAAMCKVGDLGRATRDGAQVPHDHLPFAGDRGYAPPELLYGYLDPDWNTRRLGTDVYLLGSMVVSLFTNLAMTPLMLQRLSEAHRPERWGSARYREVLPHVQSAFAAALEAFDTETRRVAGVNVAVRLSSMVRHLCDPDPARRGHPGNRRAKQPNIFDLGRDITDLDRLARAHSG